MLIRFSVSNYRSFRERAELSLYPSSEQRHGDHVVRNATIPALKTAVVYGPNASGKSNLIRAVHTAQRLIIDPPKARKGLDYHPFRLRQDCIGSPTVFEFEFEANNHVYAYGFAIDDTQVLEEWLVRIGGREVAIFELSRKARAPIFKTCKIRRSEQKFVEFLFKGTPRNKLFLAECFEREAYKEIEELVSMRDAYLWFRDTLRVIFPSTRYHGLEMEIQKNDYVKEQFSALLQSFDTGIACLDLKEVNFDSVHDVPKEIKDELLEELDSENSILISGPENQRYQVKRGKDGKVKAYKLVAGHRDDQGSLQYFDINQESDGTQRLLDFAPGLIDVMSKNKVYVIDEIDRSLHPEITRSIIENFLEKTKDSSSQLIMTTHETTVLDQQLFRRDEVYFVEKKSSGESILYSLAKFKERHDKDIRKSYLSGRYGGVPLIARGSSMSWGEEHAKDQQAFCKG